MAKPDTTDAPVRAVGYARVSTGEQASSGLGMAAQEAAIEQACEARGWQLAGIEKDNGATGTTTDRPGLQRALDAIVAGEATALVVAKLDRLSRSVQDAAAIMDRAADECWHLVALDVNVDTSTAGGRLVAGVLSVVAQWETDVISERTTAALAELKAQGVVLGDPRRVPPETVARIKRWRSRRWSLGKIAARLNAEQVPTARGGRWYASTVHGVLKRTRGQRVGG